MKLLLLTLFVAAAVASPIPDDDSGPIDVIVNGVPEGEALDIADILDIKVKEHVDGEVVATSNVLHPYTAQGLAEIAAVAAAAEAAVAEVEASQPEAEVAIPEIAPEAIVLPEVGAPEVLEVEAIALPEPATPEVIAEPQPEAVIPQPIVLPEATAPVVIETPVVAEVLPEVAAPEVVEPVVLPEVAEVAPVAQPEVVPAAAPQGEVYNDGLVQVHLNHEEPTLMSTLQSWFSMVINYVTSNEAAPTSTQIV